jgi:hypothetical protein
MAGTQVFGKPGTPAIASAIMDAASLHQAPAPAQTEHAPADGLVRKYGTLYAIASEIRNEEQDQAKLLELERVIQFADSVISEAATAMSSGGAPVPNVPAPPPPPPAPPAAPGGAQAAPAAGPPGPPQAPTPGAQA